MAESSNQLLGDLLMQVSRSFYLTLRVLPKSIRSQIGLAYLLARTTDTIADTELVSAEQRLRSLQALRERILGSNPVPIDFGSLAQHEASPAERVLLERCEEILELLRACSPEDRDLIQQLLQTITSGQELDVRRFGGASAARVVALVSDHELEDYTYRVAGCVGEFWTRICRAHLFPRASLDSSELLARSVQFGKGLQLVNILRDVAADLRKGRCYLPQDNLRSAGLNPSDLLAAASESRLRPLYDRYLDRAQSYLESGWEYTNALPWRHARVRLACAWPILIGVENLALLRRANPLDPSQRVKVSRARVRRLIRKSLIVYLFPPLWRGLLSSSPAGACAPAHPAL